MKKIEIGGILNALRCKRLPDYSQELSSDTLRELRNLIQQEVTRPHRPCTVYYGVWVFRHEWSANAFRDMVIVRHLRNGDNVATIHDGSQWLCEIRVVKQELHIRLIENWKANAGE